MLFYKKTLLEKPRRVFYFTAVGINMVENDFDN